MYCLRTIISHVRQFKNISLLCERNIRKQQITQYSTLQSPLRYFSSETLSEDDNNEKIVQSICKGDKDREQRLRILMLEVEVMRQDGRCAPNHLRTDQWEHLLDLNSRNQRSNYLSYLWKTEKSKENEKARKEARRKEMEENPKVITKEYEDDLLYGLQYQALFLRIRDISINNFDNYRALQAMINGQSVVIDCSYDNFMIYQEAVNAAKQTTFLFGDNRLHRSPFNLHLCNVNMNSSYMKQLRKNIPSLDEPWFPLNIHTESYLDLFPKEKLVYLTPHCREELTQFDHDAVYIIGCMVDKVNNEPLSLAKAKRDGIKMAKLPLDRYLEWAPGSKKNLNINHMISILLDLQDTGDWEYSLRHIPRRKLMETKILAMQNKLKKNPELSQDILKNFQIPMNLKKKLGYQEKRNRSRRSLLDDDSI